ncbi:MAG: 23S rRNA (adenine(2503)-C(2))-methyltransferase RlmN [Sumerlaeia bacterium]
MMTDNTSPEHSEPTENPEHNRSAAETAPEPVYLRGLLPYEFSAALAEAGFPAFRGKQAFQWVQGKALRDVNSMHTLPKPLREWMEPRLGGVAGVETIKESADGSVKFLFNLRCGKRVETVLMPGAKVDVRKMTLCVSSQVGCAVDCKFCVTGKNGFFRQMSADEIVDQALYAIAHLAERERMLPNTPGVIRGRELRNIVFMGMGEPLLNTDAVIKAIQILTEPTGAALSPRRITVSTSGILPGLEQLAKANLGVGLAISLNGSTQEQREQLMPITKKYPLANLLAACQRFPLSGTKDQITFEYVLMAGVNDSVEDARRVALMLRGMAAKVNVIPFNPDKVLPYVRPGEEAILAFAEELKRHMSAVTVRYSKAQDVSGACGQLAGQYREKLPGGAWKIKPRD